MSDEHVCAQDEREAELQAAGYAKPEKAYWRIGRAIFTVEAQPIDPAPGDVTGNVIGAAAAMNGSLEKLAADQEKVKLLQTIFGSPGKLVVACEGDPDSHMASTSTVELTGYRGGLDDVAVDGSLLQTVHGSREDIVRNFAEWLQLRTGWANVPRWETYDGMGYSIKTDAKAKRRGRALAKGLRKLADWMDHADDMPEEVRAKFHPDKAE